MSNEEIFSGRFLPLNDIRIKDESLFGKSAKTGLDYVKSIDVDRLLAPSYEVHDLNAPNNAVRYGGWEREGANNWVEGGGDKTYTLAGHSLGHWLSASSAFYAQTGDKEILNKLSYAIDKLYDLQNLTGSAYIGGCKEECFIRMFEGDSDWAKGYWVPWYGLHKIYQGLIDVYIYTENKTAFCVLERLCNWAADGILKLDKEFMQESLNVEYGGMNEVFAKMYELTEDKQYLEMAELFVHEGILKPLIKGSDELSGKHANTQIPKLIGAALLYEQDPVRYADYRKACEKFWDFVVNKRSYAIGGNSIAEHFEAKGAESLGIKTCESCNSYNMLKLSEHLYKWTKDAKYIDYYEDVLYNHILGQQDPDAGSKMYFVSLLQGHHRVYEEKEKSWWCCTGTGMENPARYGRAVCFEDDVNLYINLYMPISFEWNGNKISIETEYPYSDKVFLRVDGAARRARLNFRVPSWIFGKMTAVLNGTDTYIAAKGEYITIDRKWKMGDRVELTVPMGIRVYHSRVKGQIAYKFGPVTLAQQLSPLKSVSEVKEYITNETVIDSTVVPVAYIVTNGEKPEKLIETVDRSNLIFKINAKNTSNEEDIYLKPFYEIHHYFHNVYWDLDKATDRYEKALNAVTVDKVQPDGQQDEIGHMLECEKSNNGSLTVGKKSYFWRDAYGEGSYFKYTLKALPDVKYLFVRYKADEKTDFSVFVDGKPICTDGTNKKGIHDVFYSVSCDGDINVSFMANGYGSVSKVLEIRTVKEKVK